MVPGQLPYNVWGTGHYLGIPFPMAFVNNYHEPEPVTVDSKVVLDPTIPYDFNCYYTGGELGNDRIKLVPFVVS